MKKLIGDIKFRRRSEAVTDYRKRLGLVKSGMDRVVVRKSNKRIIGQIVKYMPQGDLTLKYADSGELSKFDWHGRANRATAYLTGLLLAKKAGADGAKDCILDVGLASPVKDSIPFVFAKGCIDGGMKLRGTIEIDEKVYNCSNTKHITELKSKDAVKYNKHYSGYIKAGVAPENLAKAFSETKEKILKGNNK
jgi:large subunit ribosomal protein L18